MFWLGLSLGLNEIKHYFINLKPRKSLIPRYLSKEFQILILSESRYELYQPFRLGEASKFNSLLLETLVSAK